MNLVIFTGRVCTDLKLNYLPSGTVALNFQMVTEESFFSDREQKVVKSSEFHKIVAYGNVAETISKHFSKGDPFTMKGKAKHRKYKNKDDVEVKVTEFHVDEFEFPLTKPSRKDETSNGLVSAPDESFDRGSPPE